MTLDTSRTIGGLSFRDTNWTNSGFNWNLQSSGGSILTLDNTGGPGGNPPTITLSTGISSITTVLAGSNGLNVSLPWSNYDATRGTASGGFGLVLSETTARLIFNAENTVSGALSVNGGVINTYGAFSTFGNVTSLALSGNSFFQNGEIGSGNPANNNGRVNRIGDGTATLTLGGASGAGTFSSAFAQSSNTTSQTFAGLTVNAGQNILNTSGTVAGTNNLIFTGTAGGAGYVRNTNGLLNIATATGFTPQFTNAPTAAGGSSVSGTGSDAILIGATLNGSDFIAAASGNVAAATYDTTLTAGKNVNVTGNLATSGNLSINSLRLGDTTQRTVTIGASDTLTIASGGILLPSSMATANINHTITGGNLTSGQSDLWIYSASGSAGINAGNGNPRGSSYAATIASKITGDISLSVGGGTSQLRLTGSNDYTGGTFLQNGLISINADSALGATSGTVTAVSGVNNIQTTSNFSFNSSRNFVINSGAYLGFGDNAGGQTNTIGGQISGGGQLGIGFVSNGQRLILTGNNSGFTGQYLVNGYLRADEGTGLSSNANLIFNGRGPGFGLGVLETSGSFTRSLGSGAGQVQWQTSNEYGSGGFAAVGGALNVNLGGNVTPDTVTWGNGGYFLGWSVTSQSPELILGSAASTDDVTFQNSIALNGAQRKIRVTANGTTKAVMSGTLSGNATSGIDKTGAGTLVLTGPNTYQGATTVTSGVLNIQNSDALGTVDNGTSVTSGAELQLQGGITVGAEALTLNGAGVSTTGALRNISGNNTFGGAITLGGATRINSDSGTLTLNNATAITNVQNLTFGGAGNIEVGTALQTGTGTLTKDGAGTLTLSGSNTYTGLTTISAGTLELSGGNDRLATTGAITIGASGTLDLGGNTQTTSGAVSFTSGATLKGGTLTSNNTAIANNNALTGTLNLGADGAFVTNQRLLLANGGTTSLTIGTGSTGSITFGGDNGSLMNYVGVGSGNGTLNVNGGTVNFTNATFGTGNGILNVGANSNTAAGSIVVNGGNMNVGFRLKLGGNFNNGAGTDATSSLAITSGTVTVGGGDFAGNGVLHMNGSAGDNTVNTGNSTVTLNSGGVLNVKQIQAGNQGTKTINFDGGTLRAGDSSASFLNAATGLTVNVKNGGAAIDTQAFDITVGAALVADGTGGLTKTGAGALTLSETNTYTGATTVSAGTLILSSTGSIASSQIGFGIANTSSGLMTAQNASYSFSGTLALDLLGVSATSGSWTLFNGSEFGAGDLNLADLTSNLAGLTFTNPGSLGIWSGIDSTSRTWTFNEDMGQLTVVPEPSTWALLAFSLTAVMALRRRRRA